tara:strand:+ start:257 stop:811 length:555 start_codon:yes stop_codon:yes gene_type:complete
MATRPQASAGEKSGDEEVCVSTKVALGHCTDILQSAKRKRQEAEGLRATAKALRATARKRMEEANIAMTNANAKEKKVEANAAIRAANRATVAAKQATEESKSATAQCTEVLPPLINYTRSIQAQLVEDLKDIAGHENWNLAATNLPHENTTFATTIKRLRPSLTRNQARLIWLRVHTHLQSGH